MTAPVRPDMFAAPPRPKTLLDTLAMLFGRPRAVLDEEPPSGPYAGGGEYRGSSPYTGAGDTIFIDPAGNDLHAPRDYVLNHEFGHRVFDKNSNIPEVQSISSAIRARNANTAPTEEFARAFADAMELVRWSPQHSPFMTDNRSNRADVEALLRYLRSRMPASRVQGAVQRPDNTAVKR